MNPADTMTSKETDLIFPDPFDIQNENGQCPIVFLVEHARNTIPDQYQKLGLSDDLLCRHIAWDIGIEDVSRAVSDNLDIPAIYGLYSRLLVEINRDHTQNEVFLEVSDGVPIPGNVNLSDSEKEVRLNQIYKPYHKAAADLVESISKIHQSPPLVIGMHSCTERMNSGEFRPYQIGLSTYDDDETLMMSCAEYLQTHHGLGIGLHVPYKLSNYPGVTLDTLAFQKGFPHLLFEIRQDLVADKNGVANWTRIISDTLAYLLRTNLKT